MRNNIINTLYLIDYKRQHSDNWSINLAQNAKHPLQAGVFLQF